MFYTLDKGIPPALLEGGCTDVQCDARQRNTEVNSFVIKFQCSLHRQECVQVCESSSRSVMKQLGGAYLEINWSWEFFEQVRRHSEVIVRHSACDLLKWQELDKLHKRIYRFEVYLDVTNRNARC
jgi:hypothetical protein